MSLARETDGDLEAGTEVEEEVEEEANRVEEANNMVEEVEGETEDFTSILLPVDSKERRVVLRRVSLINKVLQCFTCICKSPAIFVSTQISDIPVSQVGVSEIDVSEKEECRELRSSRQVLILSSTIVFFLFLL